MSGASTGMGRDAATIFVCFCDVAGNTAVGHGHGIHHPSGQPFAHASTLARDGRLNEEWTATFPDGRRVQDHVVFRRQP